MTISFEKFAVWQKEEAKLRDARQWLAHIGKTGRSTRNHVDILRISPAHCKPAKFTVAGQYTEGGNNYWESPDAFNDALMVIILQQFDGLSAAALVLLEKKVAEALVSAEDEAASVQEAIKAAKARATV